MENIFEEDWRNCLRAHYFHVLRERDERNERSLITVLKQTGFTDEEITALRTQTLIALGWYSPDQGDAPATTLAETSPAEAPLEKTADAPTEIVPQPQGDVEADKPQHETREDEPPAPPVQLSLF
jgi:hypothetical protein